MPLFFGLDVLLVLAAAWSFACGCGQARHGALEAILAWIWSVVALVAGTGMVLGVAGGFGPMGFCAGHAALAGAVFFWRRRELRGDWAAWVGLRGRVEMALREERAARPIALGLGLILVALGLLAVFAQPAVMDALNYHLPRFGHWLQEGRVRMIGAGDERLDYISGLPEVIMAWMVGPVAEGFHGVVLLQAVGGGLAMGATIGLARASGLSRTGALLAGGLLLGMGNVVIQFTSAQTDLFTAGVFATAFYLWLMALRRGEASLPGALGAGLALGAKGTVFYLAPAALLWMAWFLARHRLDWRQWRRTLLAGVVGVVLFAGPGLWRNAQAYGDVRGPAHWIKEFHPVLPSLAARAEKLRVNAISFLVQNLEPHSQPGGTRTLAREAGEAIVTWLPATDPYTFVGQNRREGLDRMLQRSVPDADMASFGWLTLVLFCSGGVLALVKWRQPAARPVLAWAAGAAIFFLYFNVLHQWHPFAFRYYVLIAPWVAVVAAWGVEQAGGRWRALPWTFIGACTLSTGWWITMQTHQGGWQSVAHPQRTIGYHVEHGWRAWSGQLADPSRTFLLALADDRPLAAFYRQTPRRDVKLAPAADIERAETAEALVPDRSTWVIVPAARFIGREGAVAASAWLFRGDENDPYSVVAYRLLAPGESPRPFLYRQRWIVGENRLEQELLVKAFDSGAVRLTVVNPAAANRRYTWSTPLGRGEGVIVAHGRAELSLAVPANAVAEVRLGFDGGAAFADARPVLTFTE